MLWRYFFVVKVVQTKCIFKWIVQVDAKDNFNTQVQNPTLKFSQFSLFLALLWLVLQLKKRLQWALLFFALL